MPGIIVSDTSCLILLERLGRMDILHSLFNTVSITSIVAEEFGKTLPDYFLIEDPVEKNYQRILESSLDPGEASIIALALEKEGCLLISDDRKARKEASHLKLNITGTLGVLIVALEKGYINDINVLLQEIENSNFRILAKFLIEIKRRFTNN